MKTILLSLFLLITITYQNTDEINCLSGKFNYTNHYIDGITIYSKEERKTFLKKSINSCKKIGWSNYQEQLNRKISQEQY